MVGVDVRVWKVEERQHWVEAETANSAIYRPLAFVWASRVDGPSADRASQSVGGGQNRVAPGFDIEPASVHSAQQTIFGIGADVTTIILAALSVGSREHDFPL